MAFNIDYLFRRQTQKDSAFSWYMAVVCMLMLMLTVSFICALGTVFVAIHDSYGVSREEAVLPLNAMISAVYFSGILCGPILHKFSLRKALCLAVGCEFLASFLQYFKPLQNDLNWIMICMIARGISMGVFPPVALQIVGTHFEKHRAKALMLVFLAHSLSGVIMPFIYDHAFETYGFKSSSLIESAMVLQSLVFIMLIRSGNEESEKCATAGDTDTLIVYPLLEGNPNKADSEEVTKMVPSENTRVYTRSTTEMKPTESFYESIKQLLNNGMLYVIVFSEVISLSGYYLCNTLLVDYGLDRGLTKSLASMTLVVHGIGELSGKVPTSFLVDRFRGSNEIVVGVVMCISSVLYFLLPLCSGNVFVAVVYFIGLFNGASQVSRIPLFSLLLGVHTTALTYGMASFVIGAVVLLFPVLIGKFRDELKDYKYLFYLFGILLLFVSITHFVSLLFRRTKLVEKNGKKCTV